MAFGVIPLAGLALGGLGALMRKARQRRNAQTGAAFGQAMNTQPEGPATNPLSQAATTSPTPMSPEARNRRVVGRTTHIRTLARDRQGTPGQTVLQGPTRMPSQDVQQQTGMGDTGDAGLAARLGEESLARARKKNKDQMARLSGQALSSSTSEGI